MNQELVERIVEAVLYEGYILYPYRPALKNRQRWTFGGLYPKAYSVAHGQNDPWSMQTECLVHDSPNARLRIQVRFLHLVARSIGQLQQPLREWSNARPPPHRLVDSLEVDGRRWQSWQEALEQNVTLEDVRLDKLALEPQRRLISFAAQSQWEPLRDAAGFIVGVISRARQALQGVVELSVERVDDRLVKLRVRIGNETTLAGQPIKDRHEAAMWAFVSTHTILGVQDGEFISLLDPPEEWVAQAAACQNIGTWPVLVGNNGDKDTMLSAPIILYDYPQIAPESPGSFFDGTEIDEMLMLRIMTLTDEEKRAMAGLDQRTRALLERTENLGNEHMRSLHGTMRNPRPRAPVGEP